MIVLFDFFRIKDFCRLLCDITKNNITTKTFLLVFERQVCWLSQFVERVYEIWNLYIKKMNIIEIKKKTCEVANIASQSLGSILGTENWMHLCWLNFTHTKENSDIWKVKSFFREIVWDAYIIVITRKTALLTQFSLFYNHFLSITTTLLKLPKMQWLLLLFPLASK